MNISKLIKLIELDRTEAPKVRDPKVVKVSPPAPILQSEKPEEEVEESIFIPYVLEGKKQKVSTLGMAGVMTIAGIVGVISSYFEAKERRECYDKKGEEGFDCRKRLKLQKIEQQVNLLGKRIRECSKKIGKENYFLRQQCIDASVDKIIELKEKYRDIMTKTFRWDRRM